jgi:hypothetical protein
MAITVLAGLCDVFIWMQSQFSVDRNEKKIMHFPSAECHCQTTSYNLFSNMTEHFFKYTCMWLHSWSTWHNLSRYAVCSKPVYIGLVWHCQIKQHFPKRWYVHRVSNTNAVYHQRMLTEIPLLCNPCFINRYDKMLLNPLKNC